MKRMAGWVVVGMLVVVVLVITLWFTGIYNRLVSMEEAIKTEFSQVQVQYQRRADLIPNLVEVVKGYAAHEREVFIEVTEARAKAGQINIDVGGGRGGPTNEAINEFLKAQDAISQALSRLMMVVERYPELKADARFGELQAQLEGTENRIAFARNRYNEAVMRYNSYLRRFPNNLVAGWFGFEQYPYFEAQRGAQQVPQVKF